MSINSVVISGNLCRDAELRSTGSGMSTATFTLAVSDRKRNSQTGEWEDQPNYIDCVMFGNRAETLSPYLMKGKKISISGRLRQTSWTTKDGAKRSKVNVVVEEIELPPKPKGEPAQEAEPELKLYDEDMPF